MADGGMRKCSAVEDFARRGACPPQGSGRGVAESAVRCTKGLVPRRGHLYVENASQMGPWQNPVAPGRSRTPLTSIPDPPNRYRGVMARIYVQKGSRHRREFDGVDAQVLGRYGEVFREREEGEYQATVGEPPAESAFIPWCAGASRHERLL